MFKGAADLALFLRVIYGLTLVVNALSHLAQVAADATLASAIDQVIDTLALDAFATFTPKPADLLLWAMVRVGNQSCCPSMPRSVWAAKLLRLGMDGSYLLLLAGLLASTKPALAVCGILLCLGTAEDVRKVFALTALNFPKMSLAKLEHDSVKDRIVGGELWPVTCTFEAGKAVVRLDSWLLISNGPRCY